MKIINHSYDGESAPIYFSLALRRCYNVYIIYFTIFIVCMAIFGFPLNCLRVLPWLAVCCITRYCIDNIPVRWSLLFYVIISAGWISYFIYAYGWNCGGTNFILPLMIISMFSIYDSTLNKIIFSVLLFILRMGLFFYCQIQLPLYLLDSLQMLTLQIVNTILSFVIMGVICMTFSANLQKAEKHLMLYNMELRQQAVTDPLTELYNRRKLEEIMTNHISANPHQIFSVAIGDIDFFKKINDTYGHDCGDLVLKELSRLFKEKTLGIGHVCRWGGEEFFFFFPDMNGDSASTLINDIKIAISKTSIIYQNTPIHVTMTFGISEYDFQSSLEELTKQADTKLYYGKTHGRNTVIF